MTNPTPPSDNIKRDTLNILEDRIKQFQDQTHVRRDIALGAFFVGLISISFILASIGLSVIGGPALSMIILSVYHGMRFGFACSDLLKYTKQYTTLRNQKTHSTEEERIRIKDLEKNIENAKKTMKSSLISLVLFAFLTVSIIVGTTFFPPTPVIILGIFLSANILIERHQAWKNNAKARTQKQALQQVLNKPEPRFRLFASIMNVFKQAYHSRQPVPATAFIVVAGLTSSLWISLMIIDRLAEGISHYLETPTFKMLNHLPKKTTIQQKFFLVLTYCFE